MRRQKNSQTDSLDLLLDTICNTFGGVVFIALLVAILLQTSQDVIDEHPEVEDVPAEVSELKMQLQQVTNDLEDLKATQNSQQKVIDRFASTELQEAIRNFEKSQRERDALESRRQELDEDISTRRQQIESLRETFATAEERFLDVQHEIRALKAQRERDRASRTEEVNLPVAKTMRHARQVGLIVRYGRMYVWHRYSDDGTRLGLNTDEFVVIGVADGALITTPLPTAGVKLDETTESARLIRKRLSRFNPSYTQITIVVRPDSYKQFRILRDVVIDMGFRYDLMPEDERWVMDRGGSSRPVQ